nr:putative ORF1 [Marmot picobirnavirus]
MKGGTVMTQNQIMYQNYLETRRSNQARETETNRSNLARELETNRSNVAVEGETHRHNLATEGLGMVTLQETARHNVAGEDIGYLNAYVGQQNADTNAYNAIVNRDHLVRSDTIAAYQAREAGRHNQASERLTQNANALNYALQSKSTAARIEAAKIGADASNFGSVSGAVSRLGSSLVGLIKKGR